MPKGIPYVDYIPVPKNTIKSNTTLGVSKSKGYPYVSLDETGTTKQIKNIQKVATNFLFLPQDEVDLGLSEKQSCFKKCFNNNRSPAKPSGLHKAPNTQNACVLSNARLEINLDQRWKNKMLENARSITASSTVTTEQSQPEYPPRTPILHPCPQLEESPSCHSTICGCGSASINIVNSDMATAESSEEVSAAQKTLHYAITFTPPFPVQRESESISALSTPVFATSGTSSRSPSVTESISKDRDDVAPQRPEKLAKILKPPPVIRKSNVSTPESITEAPAKNFPKKTMKCKARKRSLPAVTNHIPWWSTQQIGNYASQQNPVLIPAHMIPLPFQHSQVPIPTSNLQFESNFKYWSQQNTTHISHKERKRRRCSTSQNDPTRYHDSMSSDIEEENNPQGAVTPRLLSQDGYQHPFWFSSPRHMLPQYPGHLQHSALQPWMPNQLLVPIPIGAGFANTNTRLTFPDSPGMYAMSPYSSGIQIPRNFSSRHV